MSPASVQQNRPAFTRRLAALSMILLAVGLAAIGIILALQQVRSLTVQLMAQMKARAGMIAIQVQNEVQERIDLALREVAEHRRVTAGQTDAPPPDLPSWIDGVFVWDGEALRAVVSPTTPSMESRATVEARLASRFAAPLNTEPAIHAEWLYEESRDFPLVVAYLPTVEAGGRSTVIAALIDSRGLLSEVVQPTLAAEDGLELASVGRAGGAWSQPLSGALRSWAIRPAEAFIREQKNAVMTQTLVYAGLTVLALSTLLLAMWFLTRVVRREMALAELKANFVADVSHELKTPLALIRLFGETLQSGRVTSDEKRQEYYAIITRESTRLTNLINNILDFARIDAGRQEYTLAPTDVAQVVRETYETFRPQLDHDGFEHHLTVDPSVPRIDADRDAISQVLVNLINNAIKYSNEERYLSIDVARDTRRGRRGVLLSVHDRGIGIRPEDRAYLTDGFYRASDPRVRQRSGTGLGLALVKHIVEVHRGSLDVESRLVKGSTFRVFLPASDGDPTLAGPSAPNEPQRSGPDPQRS